MILKPSQVKRPRPAFKTMPDGREICLLDHASGRGEYKRRKASVWRRDRGICGWCLLPVCLDESTVDHLTPRGMGGGSRDDREHNLRAVHGPCNSERGSSRLLTRAEWLHSKRRAA